MLQRFQKYGADLLRLFYPHNCAGCGTDTIGMHQFLCARCRHRMPETHFFGKAGNPVERLFYGRVPLRQAGAAYYFTKQALLQRLMIELKYRGNREAGLFLGRMMAPLLAASGRFDSVEALVPLPLNPKKERQRGYNQAALVCEGIASVWPVPVLPSAVARTRFTETQTRQNRVDRWHNMEGVFAVPEPGLVQGKHLLLVDDVITTGATLEACSSSLLAIEGVTLSIGAVAYTVL